MPEILKGKKFFFVVDSELKSSELNGHFLIYDSIISTAAKELGYIPIILAQKGININSYNDIDISGSFSKGMWTVYDYEISSAQSEGYLPIIYKAIEMLIHLLLRRKISLYSFFDWIKFILSTRHNFLHKFYIINGFKFYQELTRGMQPSVLGDNSRIVFQQLCGYQLYGLAIFCLFNDTRNRLKIDVILRYNADDYLLYKHSFQLLKPFTIKNQLRYYSDSNRLCRDYKDKYDIELHLLPIPHGESKKSNYCEAVKKSKHTINVGFLGGAREEKGIIELCRAISSINTINTELLFNFYLQVHSIDSEAVKTEISNLMAHNYKNVFFIKNTLERTEYHELLSNIDIVVLPYRINNYGDRTSGILCESIGSGKICIVTNNSWMSDELALRGSGLAFESGRSDKLESALLEIAKNIDYYTLKALKLANASNAWHNPSTFMQVLESD
jgi:glycosyltransferase involved in cell wall biosynthesis